VIKPPQQPVAIRLLALALATLPFSATTTLAQSPTPPLNRNVIVLDPAHGGSDNGAHIADNLPEKQLTLAFATRLRTLLTAAGFTVITTREADPPGLPSSLAPTLTPDQRAGTANHVRALACILIHATPSGSGAHLFTSALLATDEPPDPTAVIPWDSAQSAYLTLSLRLANQLGLSLIHANIPTILTHTSIRPIDNLTCPAIALELAPNSDTPLTDTAYQQHAAQAITAALVAWRNQQPAPPKPVLPPTPTPAPEPAPSPTPTPPTGAPQ
jgi:N-acetylmuramoyl-L-alanine amidase